MKSELSAANDSTQSNSFPSPLGMYRGGMPPPGLPVKREPLVGTSLSPPSVLAPQNHMSNHQAVVAPPGFAQNDNPTPSGSVVALGPSGGPPPSGGAPNRPGLCNGSSSTVTLVAQSTTSATPEVKGSGSSGGDGGPPGGGPPAGEDPGGDGPGDSQRLIRPAVPPLKFPDSGDPPADPPGGGGGGGGGGSGGPHWGIAQPPQT